MSEITTNAEALTGTCITRRELEPLARLLLAGTGIQTAEDSRDLITIAIEEGLLVAPQYQPPRVPEPLRLIGPKGIIQ